MKVRRPDFDFSNSPMHWTRNPEFAQTINASSVWLPYLERFLNRSMAKAATQLDPADPRTPQLKEDIRIFIRQESMHYTVHAGFNQVLTRAGHDFSDLEKYFEAEYERLFTTKSMDFILGYCAGFETLGPPGARMWLDGLDKQLEGADPTVVHMWKWHLMEEYEHRNVCYDVFQALCGSYFKRVWGLVYQLWHVGKLSKMVAKRLAALDHATMTPAEVEASKKRAKQAESWLGKSLLGAALRALKPSYAPHGEQVPVNYGQAIERYEVYAI